MAVPEHILRLDSASSTADVLPAKALAPRERIDSEAELAQAIRDEQLVLHHQPQLDLRTGEILSVEALVRWNRPKDGLRMPQDFLPFAAERELIAAIDDWVLGAAAEQAVAWNRAGLPPFGIAVNVSAAQFHSQDFVERLAQTLRRKGISAHRMEIEITEDAIMRDSEATIEILERLHALGTSLSIDDFGTGHSSLKYLRRFRLDEIKIDRSFVAEMAQDDGAAGIVRGIIELAHSLKLQVIAEGVETSEQLKRLLDLKCDRAQGHLISRPVPAARLEEFLAEWPKRWRTLTR
jgi:EAL domain-containing protein (putative c-di-GMP-specific phosphodiesterase class I)